MDAMAKDSSFKRLAVRAPQPDWSEATRFERYCLLNEIPGLAFGLLAALYVVTSLLALA
jgi:hypothetical protein